MTRFEQIPDELKRPKKPPEPEEGAEHDFPVKYTQEGEGINLEEAPAKDIEEEKLEIVQEEEKKFDLEKALEDRELAFREITNSTVSDLMNTWGELQRVIPYAVCPTCQGHERDKCTLCKQRGWISKFGYEHWIPKKTRELRERANS